MDTGLPISKITVKNTVIISRTHKRYFKALKAIFITHFRAYCLMASINCYK